MGMRAETIYAIGARLQQLLDRTAAGMLTLIYLLVMTSASEGDLMDFLKFYGEMLMGLSPEAREAGAKPKTREELVAKIKGMSLDEPLEEICLHLAGLMKPPSVAAA